MEVMKIPRGQKGWYVECIKMVGCESVVFVRNSYLGKDSSCWELWGNWFVHCM
jgi:hypothetical protein